MSANDPSDDELEREAMRDVPAAVGSIGHRPKLSNESRAINPRVAIRDERAQVDGDEMSFDDYLSQQQQAQREFQQRQAMRRAPTQPRMPAVRSPLAELSRRRDPGTEPPPRRGPQPPDGPTTRADEAQAWDAFVAAALPITCAWGVEDPELAAADVADRLLEERRKRFP